ncbi:MAG: hypothetical protein FJX75_24830 [Armatimonadetes bacterium]|nr:hypothetical protein [Armatimonadota bacterium]
MRRRLPALALAATAILVVASTAHAEPLPAPLTSLTLMAWLGGWDSLRALSVAAPETDGKAEGDLEQAFRVEWQRTGNALRVKVTKLADAWVGRLAVEFRWAADSTALTYGYGDIPVCIPLADARKGRVLWAWEYGVPSWLHGESAQGCVTAPSRVHRRARGRCAQGEGRCS